MKKLVAFFIIGVVLTIAFSCAPCDHQPQTGCSDYWYGLSILSNPNESQERKNTVLQWMGTPTVEILTPKPPPPRPIPPTGIVPQSPLYKYEYKQDCSSFLGCVYEFVWGDK